MTNEFAIKVLTELRGYGDKFANIGFDRKEALDMAIKALEQTSWIPVSERLPEKQGWYLVTDAAGGMRMTEHSFFVPQEGEMEEPYWDYMNVVAWMPLPQPYKAESEDEE